MPPDNPDQSDQNEPGQLIDAGLVLLPNEDVVPYWNQTLQQVAPPVELSVPFIRAEVEVILVAASVVTVGTITCVVNDQVVPWVVP
jgi:hypothetical protein